MYCSIDDLKKKMSESEIVECLDDTGAGEFDESIAGVLNDLIKDASALIDGYAKNQVAVPLTNIDDINAVKSACIDIVVYRINSKRPGSVQTSVEENHKNAISFLRDIAACRFILRGTVEPDKPKNTKIKIRTRPQTYTQSLLDKY